MPDLGPWAVLSCRLWGMQLRAVFTAGKQRGCFAGVPIANSPFGSTQKLLWKVVLSFRGFHLICPWLEQFAVSDGLSWCCSEGFVKIKWNPFHGIKGLYVGRTPGETLWSANWVNICLKHQPPIPIHTSLHCRACKMTAVTQTCQFDETTKIL